MPVYNYLFEKLYTLSPKFFLILDLLLAFATYGNAQFDRKVMPQIDPGLLLIHYKLPGVSDYKAYHVRINPNIGYFFRPKFAADVQGEVGITWDNADSEFPLIWGGGIFTRHYFGFWEHFESFTRKDKDDRVLALGVYPHIGFRVSMLNGYFDEQQIFHKDFNKVLNIIFNPGIEFNVLTSEKLDLRIGISTGLAYFPIKPAMYGQKLRSMNQRAFNIYL